MTQLAQTYPQLAVQLAATGWSKHELTSVRAAYDLAALLFVGAERGSGKPFIDHSVGTASGVLLGGGNPETVAAALLHAAYDQGDFGRGRPSAGEASRRTVRAKVGSAVEALVFAYHRFRWSPDTASDAASTVDEASAVERAVLLMRAANEIDDAIDGGCCCPESCITRSTSGASTWRSSSWPNASGRLRLPDSPARHSSHHRRRSPPS